MTNEQQFEQDLLNIIKYSVELLNDLKNNNLEITTSDVNKTATISMQLHNMTSDLLIELPF
jgi:hypothetical protein